MPDLITLGTFDMLHPGHVALLRECKKIVGVTGKVLVAVSEDAFVEQWKHKTPVMTCAERMQVVGALKYVDYVVANDGSNQAGLIESLTPSWLAIGVDWAKRDYYGQLGITQAWLTQRRISLVYLTHELVDVVSSTDIRRRMEGS
jgi:cytidyltransferase-like protein